MSQPKTVTAASRAHGTMLQGNLDKVVQHWR